MLVFSGLLLVDYFMFKVFGILLWVLLVQFSQIVIDCELLCLQVEYFGEFGVVFFVDGLDVYVVCVVIIQYVGCSLDLQYYIWQNDFIGYLMVCEFYQVVECGVCVCILFDDMNVQDKDVLMMVFDQYFNIEICLYNLFCNCNGLWWLVEMV